jgi:signal transduction histidine kinase
MHQETTIIIYFLIFGLVVALLTISIIIFLFKQQKNFTNYAAEIAQTKLRKQKEIHEALLQGEDNERLRIAEELHDGIGAKLSGISMTLDYLTGHLNQDKDEILNKTIGCLNQTINEVREISHNLHPEILNEHNLEEIITNYMVQLNLSGSCSFKLEYNIDASINNNFKRSISRIIYELLKNIVIHAKASLGLVILSSDNEFIEISVTDNGIGIDNEAVSSGIGLKNIQNRVSFYQGVMTINAKEKGTHILIQLPLNQEL